MSRRVTAEGYDDPATVTGLAQEQPAAKVRKSNE
jgi:hypothetical protein